MFGNRPRWGRFRRPAVERFLLLDVFLREIVKAAIRIMLSQNLLDGIPKTIHAGCEKLHDQRGPEAIDNQAAESIPLGMDQSISIRDSIQSERAAAQAHRPLQALGEK